ARRVISRMTDSLKSAVRALWKRLPAAARDMKLCSHAAECFLVDFFGSGALFPRLFSLTGVSGVARDFDTLGAGFLTAAFFAAAAFLLLTEMRCGFFVITLLDAAVTLLI